MKLNAQRRAESAVLFLRDLVLTLLMIAGGVWMLLMYFEPCATATLCAVVPLVRRHEDSGRGPLWWRRLRLRMRLLVLGSRQRTAKHDEAFLRRELVLIRNLLDDTAEEREMIDDEIAWARSDLAKLQ